MKIPFNDLDGPVERDVPNAAIKELLLWVVNTNQWKLYPEIAHEKLMRFRKHVVENSKTVEPKPVAT